MSVNVNQNGELIRIANNIFVVQANWNETTNSKSTCIRNKPDTLKTNNEINENTDENALAGATAIKELLENGVSELGFVCFIEHILFCKKKKRLNPSKIMGLNRFLFII